MYRSIACSSPNCSAESSVYLVRASNGRASSVQYLCDQHASDLLPKVPDVVTSLPRRVDNDKLVNCELTCFHVSRATSQSTCVLNDLLGQRWLSFVCGNSAGQLIDEIVCDRAQGQPRVHAATLSLSRQLGAELYDVVYEDVVEEGGYGTIVAVAVFDKEGQRIVASFRASDALCLGLLTNRTVSVRSWMLSDVDK